MAQFSTHPYFENGIEELLRESRDLPDILETV
jgi:hypothetical protein